MGFLVMTVNIFMFASDQISLFA